MKKVTKIFAGFIFAAVALSSCSSDDSSMAPNGSGLSSTNSRGSGGNGVPGQDGRGGSMARFAISGNNLYTVDQGSLRHYEISDANNPRQGNRVQLQFIVETIFPYEDKLFIGTQQGMHVMGIQNPESPNLLATVTHFVSCDPVVANSRYAYVTLRGGTTCRGGNVNELQVIDLASITNPRMARTYQMVSPKGLGIDNDNLFVCDDVLKVFDATDPENLVEKQRLNINAFDVIPNNGNLLVIGSDGFYQYSYDNTNNALVFLSKISVQPIM